MDNGVLDTIFSITLTDILLKGDDFLSVLKMEAVTIAGKISDFDTIVSKYVAGREIHLENALSVLENGEKLLPFSEELRCDTLFKMTKDILDSAKINPSSDAGSSDMPYDEIFDFLNGLKQRLADIEEKKSENSAKISENEKIIHNFDTLENVDIDLTKLLHFQYIDYHFGRMPKSSYMTLKTFLNDLEAIFIKTSDERDYIWGFYFAPKKEAYRIDAVFDSLYFDEFEIPDAAIGTPKATQEYLKNQNTMLLSEISKSEKEAAEIISDKKELLLKIYNYLERQQMFEKIKKKAAHSSDFFYLVGWMPRKEAKEFEKHAHNDDRLIFFIEDANSLARTAKPPTKLKNRKIFKPYEMFVKMYGLPRYGEIDPTPFLAISYFLLYGTMFGDVGQSALFAILGFLVYKKTKMQLAAIVSSVGVSGIIFGFIYGSIFGNEDILASVRLIEPIDKIMFMLIGAVALGVIIILICMALNMVNSAREKNWGNLLFSQNGISGLIFYVSLILLLLNVVLGLGISNVLLAVLMAVTFVLMFLQEPLSELLEGNKNWMKKDGMFFVESFFEMFDVLLSFVTNTISFLRVGAFAIIHVGMMLAVTMLAGDGVTGIIVKIIGNIIVMGLEGLIVGIQVLRLEYYEMFSRYFKGDGKEFVSNS